MANVNDWSPLEDGNTNLDQYSLERQISPESELNRYAKKIMAAVRAKADELDAGTVHKDGDETVGGVKTFEEPIVGDLAVTAAGAATQRTVSSRFADSLTPKDFGAAGDGVTPDNAAFTALETAVAGQMVDLCGLSYAVDSIPSGNYYYNGSFVANGTEYTCFLQNVFSHWNINSLIPKGLDLNGDLNFFICDGVSTPATIEAARTSGGVKLRGVIAIGAGAAGGALRRNTFLSDCIALGPGVMSSGEMTGRAEHNIGMGLFALHNLTSGDRNVAIGSLALVEARDLSTTVSIGRDTGQSAKHGSGNVYLGYQAAGGFAPVDLTGKISTGYDATHTNVIAIGRQAGLHLTACNACTCIGNYAGKELKKGSGMTLVGYRAGTALDADVSFNNKKFVTTSGRGTYASSGTSITCTVSGHQAVAGNYVLIQFLSGGLNDIVKSDQQLLYVSSATAGAFVLTTSPNEIESATGNCVILGYEVSGTNHPSSNSTCIGHGCASEAAVVTDCELIGTDCAKRSGGTLTLSQVVGKNALPACATLTRSVFIGHGNATSVASAQNTVDIGGNSMLGTVNSTGDTAIGAGSFNCIETVGNTPGASIACTAVGHNALDVAVDGTKFTELKYSTGIGYKARVSGNNQVQLGGTGTTTYAHGAVQDRSDARDKTDVRDTVLGLDFLLALHPVDFRWDYRDDYIETVSHDVETVDGDGNPVTRTEMDIVRHEKDGSRKRTRFHHGLIAQEVKAVLDEKGIDFGGYQDHKVNGGCDVLTLGYEEFVGPIIKALQEINARLEILEAKHGE